MGEVCQVDKGLLLLLTLSSKHSHLSNCGSVAALQIHRFWRFCLWTFSRRAEGNWCSGRGMSHKMHRRFFLAWDQFWWLLQCLVRVLCEISVDTLVYQCVKLLWVFLGVGGLVRRTGGAPDKPSKEPPGGRPGFTAGREGRRGSAQSKIYCIGEEENQEHIAKFTAEQGRKAEQG